MVALLRMALIFYCFVGCAVIQHQIVHPLPVSAIRVVDDKIYQKDRLFAEIRYFFTADLSKKPEDAKLSNMNSRHRGVAIYYCDENKRVWIFPTRGLEEDIALGSYIARGQSDGYFGWAYDVKISQDGKFVYYKKPGLFTTTLYEYSVEQGVSTLVNRIWFN